MTREAATRIDPKALTPGTVIRHLSTDTTKTLRERKADDSGWWMTDGSGLWDLAWGEDEPEWEIESTPDEPTGQDLFDSWHSRTEHGRPDSCPVCGGPVLTVGLTRLAYTFEVCSCGIPEYNHLVETLWHRACLRPIGCAVFTPVHVRGTRSRPAYDTKECQDCGRLEEAH